jgi:hypothetical protein
MMYLGDFPEDATIRFPWSSNDSGGASVTRATNGTISVYKDGGTTQSTAGVTDTEDFDSLTGVHMVTIDASADAFYVTGSEYAVVLSGATIDGAVVNAPLACFSIERSGGVLALLKASRSEPAQGAPPVSTDFRTKVDYLYKFMRNKVTNDGTEINVFGDDGTTVDHVSAISETGGTVTRGEFGTGP